jgi:hypothetical protein
MQGHRWVKHAWTIIVAGIVSVTLAVGQVRSGAGDVISKDNMDKSTLCSFPP